MNTKEYTEPVKSRVSETLQNVQEKVSDKAKLATEATDRYVRENPWRIVGIIALASCLFGYMLGTMRRD